MMEREYDKLFAVYEIENQSINALAQLSSEK